MVPECADSSVGSVLLLVFVHHLSVNHFAFALGFALPAACGRAGLSASLLGGRARGPWLRLLVHRFRQLVRSLRQPIHRGRDLRSVVTLDRLLGLLNRSFNVTGVR